MNDFLDDLDRLHSRTRFFDHNGHTFTLTVEDPYGFWNIKVNSTKTTPGFTKGTYTNYPDAIRACKIWAESQGKVPAADKDLPQDILAPTVEKIKYKKPRVNPKV